MKIRRFLWLIVVVLPFIFRKKTSRQSDDYRPKHVEKVLAVKRIWQRSEGIAHPNSACGPTTAAMLLQYMANNQQDKIETEAALVNGLYKQIRTRVWGTSARKWRKGVKRHLNRRWPANSWDVQLMRAENQFPVYCQSIDQAIPVVLRFTLNNNSHAFASYHYILGIGYRVEEGQAKVAVLDADGGKMNESVHWIDWHENERFIKILRVIKS